MAPDPPRYLISDLCTFLEGYLPPEQVREVYRAYLFGAEAHQGQRRQSGEPYIYHPVAVARILADLRMDYKCLMAAILHDVIEDTPTAKDHLARIFDNEIAELVDGVSKLTQIDFKSRAEAHAVNFRRLMLAMTRDIRVILIKLADRLHNMRTLGVMSAEKRRRISRETLEIYAPIANRLGINSLRLELEELGFSHHWPWRHAVLEQAVLKARQRQHEMVGKVAGQVRRRLQQEGIAGEVCGREKHLYSIYRKMAEKAKSFEDLVDVFAFRVIVERVDDCYRVLGLVHNLFKPMPGRFKDYIAIPKSNGYQALHTVLVGPTGLPIEIQVRTTDMDGVAEAGIAAHWLYKTGLASPGTPALAQDWLQNLLEVQRESGDSQEFLEHVKIDLFPEEVYVFTPKGAILVLPKGATVVDFAYAIHSDIGNTCVAARIDRRLAPLRTPLRSGQTVEIINAPAGKPNPAWLNFVVTGKARANVRSYLKNLQLREAEALGRRLLNADLATLGLDLEQVDESRLAAYASASGSDVTRLLADIGLGNRLPMLVARRLAGAPEAEPADSELASGPAAVRESGAQITNAEPAPATGHSRRLAILGTEGMVVSYARCCRPIPGDPITGLFSRGKGIVVHHSDCPNLGDFQANRDRWLDVDWAEDLKAEFSTEIRVEVRNRPGALATIAAAIAAQGSNIETVQSQDRVDENTILDFLINVKGRGHLALIMRRLRQIPLVVRIARRQLRVRSGRRPR
ncbi:MAG: bifunctional (p)ppGpp synthetase/guanosine-3',5'-bis(diphosphate) 3'-pyrophosphohydrolase [Chromatiaceae bacterium]|nr:MAG: bifunctional (p)ppGpp synthetase/guanosine-3',5'-bis(diphosphate) 3'-pyrophosphohydrolase [Chromatiaceae bacterium]